VLALPRGGVPVGAEVARALDVAFDIFIVRKLGVPGHEELAMGAVASGDVSIISREIVSELRISEEALAGVTERETAELHRREQLYRGDKPAPDLTRRTVILVDDGVATGASMLAAIAAIRRMDPARIVAAVPVAPPETKAALAATADEVVILMTPEPFSSVGAWYVDFTQVDDDEVRRVLMG